jgi:hypothetical protein
MGKVEVLMSVMMQDGVDIIERTNIKSDAIVVNQCNCESKKDILYNSHVVKYINTLDRGLSKSRNLAIKEASGEYCLLCDDDEILEDDYVYKIESGFSQIKDADIICFIVSRNDKEYFKRKLKINYLTSLHISSVQIVLNRKKILDSGIKFDEKFGAGSFNGSGEENIFLFDCLKKKLKVYYLPITIGRLIPSDSTWFEGFNQKYFICRGRIFKRLFGNFGYIYLLYFIIAKHNKYKDKLSIIEAFILMCQGMGYVDKKGKNSG